MVAATPPIRPSHLATSYLRTAHAHHDHITHTLVSLHSQHAAVRIASSSLDLNVLAIADAFEGIAGGARVELEKQAGLLAGLEADLEIISRVKIHAEFMSQAVRKAVEAGEKARTLGDYVSNVKMKQVADTCARTHGKHDIAPWPFLLIVVVSRIEGRVPRNGGNTDSTHPRVGWCSDSSIGYTVRLHPPPSSDAWH